MRCSWQEVVTTNRKRLTKSMGYFYDFTSEWLINNETHEAFVYATK